MEEFNFCCLTQQLNFLLLSQTAAVIVQTVSLRLAEGTLLVSQGTGSSLHFSPLPPAHNYSRIRNKIHGPYVSWEQALALTASYTCLYFSMTEGGNGLKGISHGW